MVVVFRFDVVGEGFGFFVFLGVVVVVVVVILGVNKFYVVDVVVFRVMFEGMFMG